MNVHSIARKGAGKTDAAGFHLHYCLADYLNHVKPLCMLLLLALRIEIPFFIFLMVGISFFVLAWRLHKTIVSFKRGGVKIKAEIINVKVDKNAEWDRYYPTLRFTTPETKSS